METLIKNISEIHKKIINKSKITHVLISNTITSHINSGKGYYVCLKTWQEKWRHQATKSGTVSEKYALRVKMK